MLFHSWNQIIICILIQGLLVIKEKESFEELVDQINKSGALSSLKEWRDLLTEGALLT